MGKVAEAIGGAALIAGGIVLDVASVGVATPYLPYIFSAGASLLLGGVAGLITGNPQTGVAVAGEDPIGVWAYCYGKVKVGGVTIFDTTNSSQGVSNDKQLHRIHVLACHPCNIVVPSGNLANRNYDLRLDGQGTTWSYSGLINGAQCQVTSTPAQVTANITSISRTGGLVTINLSSSLNIIATSGQSMLIQNVADNTYNGVFMVNQTGPTQLTCVNGGADGASSGGSVTTLYADYGGKIDFEIQDGTQTETFYGALTSGLNWNTNCLCTGKTVAYVRMGYDSSVFSGGIPKVSFVIEGKKDILDPRTGQRGYTTNAALCIADFLCLPTDRGGFGMSIGTNLPGLYVDEAQLIAAANICDEQVELAAGGTQSRYTLNAYLPLSLTRGTILTNMLSACAGRITREGGAYKIFPGAWVGSTFSGGVDDLRGPVKLNPLMSARDICNGVKGTYIAPANNYQQADFPPYAQDTLHGYASDANQAMDGGDRIWLDVQLQCTNDSATAQRLAKIELKRRRYQGRYTVRLSMRAFSVIAMDVIDLTIPRYNWVAKLFEVLNSRIVIEKTDANGAPVLCMELDLAETGSDVYDWFTTEELASQGYASPALVDTRVCPYPEQVVCYSGPGGTINGIVLPSTISTTASGISTNSLYVQWLAPNDGYVTNGGYIEVQYQQNNSSGSWIAFGTFDPSVRSCFIPSLSDGTTWYVRVRAVNCAGTPSDWVIAGPETISMTLSLLAYSGTQVAPDGTLIGVALNGTAAEIEISPFTANIASQSASCTPIDAAITLDGTIGGTGAALQQGVLYDVYYVDTYFAGGTIAPIATTNPTDYLNKAGYFLIGTCLTPNVSSSGSIRLSPTTYTDLGARSTSTPAAAFDGNLSTVATVLGSCADTGSSVMTANGECAWSGWPAGSVAYDRKLYITIATSFATLSNTGTGGGGGGGGGGTDPVLGGSTQ